MEGRREGGRKTDSWLPVAGGKERMGRDCLRGMILFGGMTECLEIR